MQFFLAGAWVEGLQEDLCLEAEQGLSSCILESFSKGFRQFSGVFHLVAAQGIEGLRRTPRG